MFERGAGARLLPFCMAHIFKLHHYPNQIR